MLKVSGYTINEIISENPYTAVCRAKKGTDSEPVILKILKNNPSVLEKMSDIQDNYESLSSLKQIKALRSYYHEYEILQLLNQSGTVAVLRLEKIDQAAVMVLEDGGIDLSRYLSTHGHLMLSEALTLAQEIVLSLEKIHNHHIIHKKINPKNILIDPASKKVKIIDFTISTTLNKESLEVFTLNQLDGILPYVSPEQTGRMNRGIDYRSDYYSLGVTLYQLLTGVLPFQAKDPLEIVHAHLVELPLAPQVLNTAIPKTISDIIMNLLKKTAEERYQSLYGLLYDLKRATLQYQQTGTVEDFPLGTQDFSGRFQIPEKLYGRTNEINFLLATFARVSQGPSEFMLIAGHAGIGKSSLVSEVQKPIVAKHGHFIAGKFDQLNRNIPYAPFMQALEGLIQQLLVENDDNLELWKKEIVTALGPNGAVVTAVLPSLVKIIGEQPQLPVLGPTETQNRFISVFQNFIQVLATREHPLVIFLDDLQWVDLPSLTLLKAFLSQPSIKYLLLIGAYRDNEVSSMHPLMISLDQFKKQGVIINTLQVAPLQIPHIQALLADTLHQKLEIVQPLAETCYAKTLGNPFFLNQFLRALHEERLIIFDTEREFWHWEIDKIKSRVGTENVIDLLVKNIQKLSTAAHSMLKYAACIGNRFELQILAALAEKTPKATNQILQEVMQENYILPLDESYRFIDDTKNSNAYYQFLHDRVQQASYSLLSDAEKKSIHLKIGQLLLQLYKNKPDEKLFDIVNQLNLGSELMTKQADKIELAQLNLNAGKKATLSAAFSAAFNYFEFGLSLLDQTAWKTHYALNLDLHTNAAEAAYLCGQFDISEQLGNQAMDHAKSVLDQVKIYETRIFTEVARNSPSTAIKISLEVLRKLGVKFPKNPNKMHIILAILRTKFSLLWTSNERLLALPVMQDPKKLAACRVLSAAIAPSYYAAPALYPLISLTLLNLSIRYGYNKGSPVAYASYGIILAGVLGELNRAYDFGQLALKLIERHHAVESEAKVLLIVSGLIAHWREPYRNSLATLLAAYMRGIETGDLEYAAYATVFYIECALESGVVLAQVAEDTKKFSDLCQHRYPHKPVLHSLKIYGQALENLRGLAPGDPTCLTGSYYNEVTSLQEAFQINHFYGIFHFHNFKLMLNYLFYHYDDAYQAALIIPSYIHSVTAAASVRVFVLYDSLTRLMLYTKATSAQQRQFRKEVLKNQKKMKHWAKSAPMNCSAPYFLVEAELARVRGQQKNAIENYDKAIQIAKQTDYLQILALANELAAIFYVTEKNEQAAKQYMFAAYRAYSEWGANAKLRHLEKKWPLLLTDNLKTVK